MSSKNGAPAALNTVKSDRPLTAPELLELADYPPSAIIDGPIDRTVDIAKGLYVYKFHVREDLLAFEDVRSQFHTTRTQRFKNVGTDEDRARIVIYTDPQWGKTDENGGTPETARRSANIRAQVLADIERDKPGTTVLADAGDGVENFFNVASQARTNDLSMTGQQRAYLEDTKQWAFGLQRRSKCFIHAVCCSNHGREKGPAGYVDQPSADYGFHNSWLLEQLFQAKGVTGEFHRPTGHDEAVAFEVLGFKVGLVHGHLAELEKWWKGQQLGDTEVADARYLIAGHKHNPTFKYVSRDRVFFQGAALDNGSSWLKNITGQSAPAGVVTFDIVRGRGFDTQSYRFYTEQ